MRDNPKVLRAPNFWILIESFFGAYTEYQEIFNNYDERVINYAFSQGVDRRYLHLSAEEVGTLLEFDKLEALRDGVLFQFKHCTHSLFRLVNIRTRERIDRYANEIFHNISILKEVQYIVETFAPHYDQEADRDEYQSILKEVHEEFPTLVNRINALFKKAHKQIALLMKQDKYKKGKIFIRSLYLYGDDLVSDFEDYPFGIADIYDQIYDCGALEGYLKVASSFKESGFNSQARGALAKAIQAFARQQKRLEEAGESPSPAIKLLVSDLELLRDELATEGDDPGMPEAA